MPYVEIGNVKSGKSRKTIRVKWNNITGEVQIDQPGLLGRGITVLPTRANNPSQAMMIAEAYVRNE